MIKCNRNKYKVLHLDSFEIWLHQQCADVYQSEFLVAMESEKPDIPDSGSGAEKVQEDLDCKNKNVSSKQH